jgi:RNA polymerase sigma-70 factor (ECF subfamily)
VLHVGADEGRGAETIETLFERCERRLGRYLAQMVRGRSLAEDLLQETFHKALRSGSQLASAQNQEAWLFGVARKLALQALRKRRRFQLALSRFPTRPRAAEDSAEVVAARELLERALTPEDRSLVLLRYLHGFSAVELAEAMGLSADAVRQRLSRARRRILDAATTRPEGGPR